MFAENASQKSVFDTVALPLVEDVLNGKNGMWSFICKNLVDNLAI